MEKSKLEILGLSASPSQTGSFALVLGELGGNRRLPIIIGMFEAQAIAIEMEKVVTNRPMTHDLFKSFAKSFHINITEVVISELKEGIFFARIVCNDGLRTHSIDARPSDAIAIAVRFNVPIYASEQVLEGAGILAEDEAEEVVVPVRSSQGSGLKDIDLDELNRQLEKAINQEDYELAAKIRDEISKRN